MNEKYELMVSFGNAGWVYFKTDKPTAQEAFSEFRKKIEDGIDFSNFPYEGFVTEAVLRDENHENVDSLTFSKK